MQSISTIGLDIAKSVFQGHGVDAVALMAKGRGGIKPLLRLMSAPGPKLSPHTLSRTNATITTSQRSGFRTVRKSLGFSAMLASVYLFNVARNTPIASSRMRGKRQQPVITQ